MSLLCNVLCRINIAIVEDMHTANMEHTQGRILGGLWEPRHPGSQKGHQKERKKGKERERKREGKRKKKINQHDE